MSDRTPTADVIARRIAAMLPHGGGAVPADVVRTAVRRRLSPVSDEAFRAAVVLGRARGDFIVHADGAIERHPCAGAHGADA